MPIPKHLEPAMAAVLASLERQRGLDPDLLVTEPDADGRVQIEGTVDLAALIVAAQHVSRCPHGEPLTNGCGACDHEHMEATA